MTGTRLYIKPPSQDYSIDHPAGTRQSHPADRARARIDEKLWSTKDAVLDAIKNSFNRLRIGIFF